MGVVISRASRGVVAGLAIGVAVALIIAGTPSRAMADEPYPNRPIHLVVPYSTGNTIDFAARLLARSISEHVGQPVIVENKVGSSGNIGADYVAKAAPDGYTVLFTGTQITSLPTLMPSVAVDPLTSLAPITRLAEQPFLIVANPQLGVSTLPELIARARAEPGRIAYSTSGIGATTHLAAALIFQRAGVALLSVPYTHGGDAVKDLLSGEVQVASTFIANVESQLRAKRLTPLAVTTKQRIAAWPDIPTVAEQGFPGYEVTSWYAFFAPAGTPPEIVRRLQRELVRAAEEPAIRAQFVQWGNTIVGNSPEEFAGEVKTWVTRWAAIVKQAGIRVQ